MANLNERNIDEFIRKEDKAMVLFYADWCPYSQAFLRTVEKKKHHLKHEVHFVNLSDEDNKLWEAYGVEYVPTLVAFSKGSQVHRRDAVPHVGLNEKDLVEADRILHGGDMEPKPVAKPFLFF